MSNPFSNLSLDTWYKAALPIGAAVLLLALTVELKGVENSIALLISIGVIFVGSGEWINHPKTTSIRPPSKGYPGYLQIEKYERKNTLLGNLFLVFGLILIGYGTYSVVV